MKSYNNGDISEGLLMNTVRDTLALHPDADEKTLVRMVCNTLDMDTSEAVYVFDSIYHVLLTA